MSATSEKQRLLQSLQEQIISDGPCPRLVAGATQLVMGEGSANAEIVFIGEAPGKKEDELGRPFIGASGKFLDEMLSSASLSRQDVYITNIVKYRPPDNRDPLPEEKKAFLPYLLEQLDIIQPKIVVTLGRHSMEYFLPDAKIGEVHGQAIRQQVTLLGGKQRTELLIMPLYHPAAALYNRKLRETLLSDMRRLTELLTT